MLSEELMRLSKFLSYSSPVISIFCFSALSLYTVSTKRDNKNIAGSKTWCHLATVLCIAVSLCYLVETAICTTDNFGLDKEGRIHALSEFLLWITLALLRLSTTSPPSLIYTITWGQALLFESIVRISSRASFQGVDAKDIACLSVQALSIFLMAMLSAVGLRMLFENQVSGASSETQALLSDSTSETGIPENDVCYGSALSDDKDSEDDSDSEDEDAEFRALQYGRVNSSGGWMPYLKDFVIFWPYLWPKGNARLLTYIAILVLNTLFERALNVLHPRQLGIVIDRLNTESSIPWADIFLWLLYELLASSSTGLGALNEFLEHRVSKWSFQQLSVASFDHLMGLSMTFHDEKDSGEIIKAVEQAGSLNSLLKTLVLQVIPAVLDVLIALWYIFYLLDAYAVLTILAVAIAFAFVTFHVTTLATIARRHSSVRERLQSKVLYETVSNWSLVSYFGRRSHEKARLSRVVKLTAEAGVRNDDISILLWGLQELCEWFGRLGISILAAYRITMGISPIGTFVVVESYWDTITWPLYLMGHSYRQLTSDLVDAERLLQLFKTTPAVKDSEHPKPIEAPHGSVDFEDICFQYGNGRPVLSHLSFTVKAGQTVALVGETGGGKSTILKLLMRFYDVTSGKISIDGQDIREVTQDSLRALFGFVPQETVLFNISILENVRYGRLDATDSDVFDACRAAAIHDKILTFPEGYHTKVGERGIKLSGGELQRISIARVILKRPEIVLLDEATSAVDSHTEVKIQNALQSLTKGRTTFVIAHRLSAVVEADLILVIDQGVIVEKGTHADLIERGGRYNELWRKQISKHEALI